MSSGTGSSIERLDPVAAAPATTDVAGDTPAVDVQHDRYGNAFIDARSAGNTTTQIDSQICKRLTLCSSFADVSDAYGSGYYYYFDFIRFQLLVNLVMLLLALGNWIPHLVVDGFRTLGNFSGIGVRYNFYLASYSPHMYTTWFVTNLVALVFVASLAPALYFASVWLQRSYYHRRSPCSGADRGLPQSEPDGYYYGGRSDDIVENAEVPAAARLSRLAVATGVMCGAVLLLLVVNLGVVVFYANAVASGSSALTAVGLLVLGLFVSPQGGLEEMLMIQLSTCLAYFTRPLKYSQLRRRQILYLFLIRVGSMSFLLSSEWFVVRYPGDFILDRFEPNDRRLMQSCGLLTLGDFYLEFMLVALIVMPPINTFLYPVLGRFVFPFLNQHIVAPLVRALLCCRCAAPLTRWYNRRESEHRARVEKRQAQGDPNALWGEFAISNEYNDAIYRQFLVLIGLPVFPLIALLGLLACMLELVLGKLRLIYFSHRPPPLEGSQRTLLTTLMFAAAVIAALTYPVGQLWLFEGIEYRDSCPGTLW